MAKKKKPNEIEDISIYDNNIELCDTGEYIKEVMLLYGINVSVFRACAALLDGLIPVRRRMIYAFYKAGATNDKPMRKAVDLVGKVSGLHPHGEGSIATSFRNEIKAWETNAPLLEVQGNTGSLTGEKPAALRYLDAKLSKYAMKCFFDDFDEDITDMVESNTRTEKEPVFIPAKYPNFLLSLMTGMGWGNRFDIVPFNLSEVFKLTIALIKNPNMTGVHLYPDSPRGYQIIENDNIQEICDIGKGTIRIQAILQYNEEENYISVRGLPEQTYVDPILAKISTLVKEGQLTGIETYKDLSLLDDTEVHIILKKGADPRMVIHDLYTKTSLRSYININMNFAGRTEMMPLGLKSALLVWIQNRIDTVQRLNIKRLSRKSARLHEIEGALILLDANNINKTIDLIKTSNGDKDATEKLMMAFGVTSYQADVVLSLNIRRINIGSRIKFEEEKVKIEKEIKDLTSIVSSKEKIKEIIINELEEGIKLFGTPRRCQVIAKDTLEAPKLHFNLIVTKKYIKKISVSMTSVGQLESDDEVISSYTDIADDSLLHIIDDFGNCSTVALHKLNPNDLVSKGTALKDIFKTIGTPIRSFIENGSYNPEDYSMVIFTKFGFIKKTPLIQYLKSRKELSGILLNPDDRVCYMTITNNDTTKDDVKYTLIYTANGFGISVDLNNIATTERLTKGTKYLSLDDGDQVSGIFQTNSEKVFIITTKGYAKICLLDDIFQTAKRRASMIRLSGLNDGDTIFTMIPIDESNEKTKVTCYMQSGEKMVFHMNEVERTTRVSKGKKLVRVKRGDNIIKIKL